MIYARSSLTTLHHVNEIGVEQILAVCSVESVSASRFARNKAEYAELAKLVLNGRKPESAHARQFAHVPLLVRSTEKQSQYLSPDLREEHFQNRALSFHFVERIFSYRPL